MKNLNIINLALALLVGIVLYGSLKTCSTPIHTTRISEDPKKDASVVLVNGVQCNETVSGNTTAFNCRDD